LTAPSTWLPYGGDSEFIVEDFEKTFGEFGSGVAAKVPLHVLFRDRCTGSTFERDCFDDNSNEFSRTVLGFESAPSKEELRK